MIDPMVNITSQSLTNPLERIKSGDPKEVEKQIEIVFITELLKHLFEHTEFGKNKNISPYMPFFTSEMAKSFAERGIGIGEFLNRTERLKNSSETEPRQIIQNGFINRSTPISEPVVLTVPKRQHSDKGASIADDKEKNTSGTENISPNPFFDNLPITLRMPAEGKITSHFGLRRDPFDGKLRQHNGIDIALKEGTEIKAAASGTVVFSGEAKGYGKVVIVEHEGGISTLYGHNSVNLVKKGDRVEAGQTIALSGSTGRATGPHLHFEVRKEGEAVDPTQLIG